MAAVPGATLSTDVAGETVALVWLALAKAVTYVGTLTLAGAVAAVVLLKTRVEPAAGPGIGGGEAPVRAVAVVAGVLVAVAALTRAWAQTYSVFGLDEPVTLELVRLIALESRWGSWWIWQAAAAALALVAAAWLWSRRPGGWGVAGLAALALAITLPTGGHAVAAGDATPLAWTLQGLHTLAGGLWVGTLAALVAVLWTAPRDADGDRRVSALVHAYSPLAMLAVGTILVTGGWTTVLYVHGWADLWTGEWGRTLLVKALLVAATGLVGVYNWRRLRPRLPESAAVTRLGRTARAELSLALLVLLATAVLVHLPKPHE